MDDVPRYRAWALTWISYATYYMGRKNFSVAKPAIIAELGKHALTPLHLGGSVRVGVETAYLATYALGQWISGTISSASA
jgi:sugar phosphate permease